MSVRGEWHVPTYELVLWGGTLVGEIIANSRGDPPSESTIDVTQGHARQSSGEIALLAQVCRGALAHELGPPLDPEPPLKLLRHQEVARKEVVLGADAPPLHRRLARGGLC